MRIGVVYGYLVSLTVPARSVAKVINVGDINEKILPMPSTSLKISYYPFSHLFSHRF